MSQPYAILENVETSTNSYRDNSQLNTLAGDVKNLGQRLANLDVEQMTNESRIQLDEWRVNAHKTIDRFYEQKFQELYQYTSNRLDQHRNRMTEIGSKLNEFIDKQKVTQDNIHSLSSSVRILEREINQIEQYGVQIDIDPFVLDKKSINIRKSFDLATFSSAYSTMNYSEKSSTALTSNGQYLLFHQEPNLCLIDQESKIIKQNPWPYSWIRDMCWLSALGRFFVLTDFDCFLVDEKTLSIKYLQAIPRHHWFSCTSSETTLFLSTCQWGSSICEFNLLPTIRFSKLWIPPISCSKDEGIHDIIYNNNTLALMIGNPVNSNRKIELRLVTTLDRIWSLSLDTIYNIRLFTCCSLNQAEWLVVDGCTLRLIHIDKEGNIKAIRTCQSVPYRATLFGSYTLALADEHDLNLFQL